MKNTNVIATIDKSSFDKANIFGQGELNTAYAAYFVGKSYLKSVTLGKGLRASNVTFEPSCRNSWHIHKATNGGGQVLLCVAGEGWYQEWGKDALSLTPGSVVEIPAGVKHWHGAKKDSWFSHIAIEVPGKNSSSEWLEKVCDTDYERLPGAKNVIKMKKQTAGREKLGNFAPKFAQLNDDILFGEVWANTAELSPRDRSIITVAALIGAGVTDSSLMAHLNMAQDHGVTQDEMVGLLTHVAFYVGWPRAWAVLPMARDVYQGN